MTGTDTPWVTPILRSVASLFREAARRRTDLAARIGGDEFAIIVPETDRSGVPAIIHTIESGRAQLVQDTFKAWSFPTLSFGFCTVTPSDSSSAFALYEAADAALYEAKAAGRDGTAECGPESTVRRPTRAVLLGSSRSLHALSRRWRSRPG